MKITEITADMLPLYTVETYRRDGWETFTVQPFVTREEAERHREVILVEFGRSWADRDKVRVGEYTAERWRADLIDAVIDDREATRRALSILRTETLADLLK